MVNETGREALRDYKKSIEALKSDIKLLYLKVDSINE